jgi:hypothetical protein
MKVNILKKFIESIMRFIESIIDKYTELAKSKSSAKNMMRIFDEPTKNIIIILILT